MSGKIFEEYLKSKHVSITAPRKKIYETLLNTSEPISMDQLIKLCKPLNRVTVYRVIELFERISVVHRIQVGWKYKLELSDLFHQHHHHITCSVCHKIVGVEEPEGFEEIVRILGESKGFIIDNHILELSGKCKNCQS